MKITDKPPVPSLTGNDQPAKAQPKGADFARTLAEAGHKVPGRSEASSGASAASELMDASPVGRILAANLTSPVVRMEKALGLLDRFARSLGDPSQTLKQMSGLVRELEEEAGRLTRLSRELPPDHGLRPLIDRAAVMAAVEAAKFNRGDYV